MAGKIKPIETLYRGYRFRSRVEARWAIFFDVAGIPWQYEPEGFDLSSVQAPSEVKLLWASERMNERLGRSVHTGDVNQDDEGWSMWYLPDFYLPEQDCWIEIKASEPTLRDRRLMECLVWATETQGFIFWDQRPPSEVLRSRLPADLDRRSALGLMKLDAATMFEAVTNPEMEVVLEEMLDLGPDDALGPILTGSYFNQWCECPVCGKLGIAPEGEAHWLECECVPTLPLFSVPFAKSREIADTYDPVYCDDSQRLTKAYMAARQARFEHGERTQMYELQSKLDRIREVLDADDF
jgi:hypothetical protein